MHDPCNGVSYWWGEGWTGISISMFTPQNNGIRFLCQVEMNWAFSSLRPTPCTYWHKLEPGLLRHFQFPLKYFQGLSFSCKQLHCKWRPQRLPGGLWEGELEEVLPPPNPLTTSCPRAPMPSSCGPLEKLNKAKPSWETPLDSKARKLGLCFSTYYTYEHGMWFSSSQSFPSLLPRRHPIFLLGFLKTLLTER